MSAVAGVENAKYARVAGDEMAAPGRSGGDFLGRVSIHQAAHQASLKMIRSFGGQKEAEHNIALDPVWRRR